MIKAEGVSGLTPATIGKSSDLKVGEGVVAIGSPFGLDSTVTSGIVSALNRPVDVGSDGEGNSTTYPAIQTDAAINPGNSGGAAGRHGRQRRRHQLLDPHRQLVARGEAGSIGLGFAIPIDEVLPIVDQMSKGETPTHARLGISGLRRRQPRPAPRSPQGAAGPGGQRRLRRGRTPAWPRAT